jgi:hypothetical protein
MPITPLKSKRVSTHDDDDEVEESELDEYKVWLAALHKVKKVLAKIWYNPIFVYIYS